MAKKEKNDKNYGAAKAFSARKQDGRPKQVWVWDIPPRPAEEIENYKNSGETAHVASFPGLGHWEKAAE